MSANGAAQSTALRLRLALNLLPLRNAFRLEGLNGSASPGCEIKLMSYGRTAEAPDGDQQPIFYHPRSS